MAIKLIKPCIFYKPPEHRKVIPNVVTLVLITLNP